jgi:hypothetical protein
MPDPHINVWYRTVIRLAGGRAKRLREDGSTPCVEAASRCLALVLNRCCEQVWRNRSSAIDVLRAPVVDSSIMVTFLKVFFGIVLLVLGILFVGCSPFAAVFFGGAGFIVQVIVAIALLAGAITLFVTARR